MNQEIFPLQNPDQIVFVAPVPVANLVEAIQQRQDEEDEAIKVSPVIRRRRTRANRPRSLPLIDEALERRTMIQSEMNLP